MGDKWMTSGRSRLRAIEKHGVGKRRGWQRNSNSGAPWEVALPRSTQPPNHPQRPKSSAEFLGYEGGYVDPFLRRAVVPRRKSNNNQPQQSREQTMVTATHNPNIRQNLSKLRNPIHAQGPVAMRQRMAPPPPPPPLPPDQSRVQQQYQLADQGYQHYNEVASPALAPSAPPPPMTVGSLAIPSAVARSPPPSYYPSPHPEHQRAPLARIEHEENAGAHRNLPVYQDQRVQQKHYPTHVDSRGMIRGPYYFPFGSQGGRNFEGPLAPRQQDFEPPWGAAGTPARSAPPLFSYGTYQETGIGVQSIPTHHQPPPTHPRPTPQPAVPSTGGFSRFQTKPAEDSPEDMYDEYGYDVGDESGPMSIDADPLSSEFDLPSSRNDSVSKEEDSGQMEYIMDSTHQSFNNRYEEGIDLDSLVSKNPADIFLAPAKKRARRQSLRRPLIVTRHDGPPKEILASSSHSLGMIDDDAQHASLVSRDSHPSGTGVERFQESTSDDRRNPSVGREERVRTDAPEYERPIERFQGRKSRENNDTTVRLEDPVTESPKHERLIERFQDRTQREKNDASFGRGESVTESPMHEKPIERIQDRKSGEEKETFVGREKPDESPKYARPVKSRGTVKGTESRRHPSEELESIAQADQKESDEFEFDEERSILPPDFCHPMESNPSYEAPDWLRVFNGITEVNLRNERIEPRSPPRQRSLKKRPSRASTKLTTPPTEEERKAKTTGRQRQEAARETTKARAKATKTEHQPKREEKAAKLKNYNSDDSESLSDADRVRTKRTAPQSKRGQKAAAKPKNYESDDSDSLGGAARVKATRKASQSKREQKAAAKPRNYESDDSDSLGGSARVKATRKAPHSKREKKAAANPTKYEADDFESLSDSDVGDTLWG